MKRGGGSHRTGQRDEGEEELGERKGSTWRRERGELEEGDRGRRDMMRDELLTHDSIIQTSSVSLPSGGTSEDTLRQNPARLSRPTHLRCNHSFHNTHTHTQI